MGGTFNVSAWRPAKTQLSPRILEIGRGKQNGGSRQGSSGSEPDRVGDACWHRLDDRLGTDQRARERASELFGIATAIKLNEHHGLVAAAR